MTRPPASRGEGGREVPPHSVPPRPTGVRVVHAAEVEELLPMEACIEAVEQAFRGLARGEARQPPRTVIELPAPSRAGTPPTDLSDPKAPEPRSSEAEAGPSFLAMPAYLGTPACLGAKLLTLFPGNRDLGIPSHQGVIIVFDPRDGAPAAVVDAASVTALRTAAASAVATQALAREDAAELAVLGSGVQARSHVEAMLAVRPIRRVRAWSPTRAHLEAFVEEMADRHDVPVEAAPDAPHAVDGADVVCTVTHAREPVLLGDWLAEGAHVNAVGASTPETREVDGNAVARSRFYVDSRESARLEAGDWLLARAEGAVPDSHLIGEIGEVLEGAVPGRTSPRDITMFESLGLAVQDLAAVARILE